MNGLLTSMSTITSFTDIFKKSFLEGFTKTSFPAMILSLASALAIGMFIFFIYKKTFAGVMYSRPFNTSLVLLTLLTTFVILAVTSNVVLSLGMVGALSIVRFRTAIKDPLDLVFLFWAIGAGIILGAGMYGLAFGGSLMIGVILYAFVMKSTADLPYILMLNVESEAGEAASYEILKRNFGKLRLKSKTVTPGKIELIYEIRIKNSDTAFVNELSSLRGVLNVAMVSYNGDYAA